MGKVAAVEAPGGRKEGKAGNVGHLNEEGLQTESGQSEIRIVCGAVLCGGES